MRYLIIGDDNEIKNLTRQVLSPMGKCDYADNGDDGLFMALSGAYDMIMADWRTPKGEIINIIKRYKAEGNGMPFVIVSKENNVTYKVDALEAGADDYICFPLDRREYEARARAILRRYGCSFDEKYVFNEIVYDFTTRKMTVNGEVVVAPGKEGALLECLIRNRNVILNKDQLFNKIWGLESDTMSPVIEVFLSSLRKELDRHGIKKYLRTLKGVGYMWDEKAEEQTDKN